MLGFDALSKRSRVARRLVLSAAAKINLALEVLGKRDDGYHEVATVMQAVDLSDRLVIEDAEILEVRASAPDVPSDGSNLVARAAHALREAAAVSRGARIRLDKRIPVAAGLGGGSADAAATLVGLSRLWGLRWSVARLDELAVTLGTDGPFFLRGGAVLGTGRGERIEPVVGMALPLVLGNPGVGASTPPVYGGVTPAMYSDGSHVRQMVAALRSRRPARVAASLRDARAGGADGGRAPGGGGARRGHVGQRAHRVRPRPPVPPRAAEPRAGRT